MILDLLPHCLYWLANLCVCLCLCVSHASFGYASRQPANCPVARGEAESSLCQRRPPDDSSWATYAADQYKQTRRCGRRLTGVIHLQGAAAEAERRRRLVMRGDGSFTPDWDRLSEGIIGTPSARGAVSHELLTVCPWRTAAALVGVGGG